MPLETTLSVPFEPSVEQTAQAVHTNRLAFLLGGPPNPVMLASPARVELATNALGKPRGLPSLAEPTTQIVGFAGFMRPV
jgi:hypothetical protein